MRLQCKPGLFVAATTLWATTATAYGLEAPTLPAATPVSSLNQLFHDIRVQYKISLAGQASGDVPSVVARVWATYAFTPTISASVGLRHVSRAYTSTETALRWSDYSYNASLDLTMTWQISPRLRMIGRLHSAANNVHAVHIGSVSAHVGIPKAVNVALEYRF